MKDYIVPEGSAFNIDWEAFRRETAKDILCAMLSTTIVANPKVVTTAIEITDELIKQLKEDEK